MGADGFWSVIVADEGTTVGVELAGATEGVVDAGARVGVGTADGLAAAVTAAWNVPCAAEKRLSPAKATVTVSFEGCPAAGSEKLAEKLPLASVTPRAVRPPKSQEMSTREESTGTPPEERFPVTASTAPAATGLGVSWAVMTVAGGAVVAGALVAGALTVKRCVADAKRYVVSPAYVAVTTCVPTSGSFVEPE
jgi:hypothetical protein